jgi:hypothetical protein
MQDWLRESGLDPEFCSIQTDMLTGLGEAYLSEAESAAEHSAQYLLLAAATNFRRAGSNSLLLDQTDEARRFFSQAAKSYGRARLPYAAFISNLGSESYSFEQRETRINSGQVDPADAFLLWGPQALENTNEASRIRHAAETVRTRRVGLFGLEVGVYLDLFDAAVRDSSPTRLAESLLPVVSAYSLGVRRASQDRYHWRRLAIPFHPAEPDVLALLVSLDRRLATRDGAVAPLLRMMPLAWESLSLLSRTLGQLGAWRDEKSNLS